MTANISLPDGKNLLVLDSRTQLLWNPVFPHLLLNKSSLCIIFHLWLTAVHLPFQPRNWLYENQVQPSEWTQGAYPEESVWWCSHVHAPQAGGTGEPQYVVPEIIHTPHPLRNVISWGHFYICAPPGKFLISHRLKDCCRCNDVYQIFLIAISRLPDTGTYR